MPSFPEIEVTAAVERAFQQDKIAEPSPIQKAAIPEILAGRHAILESGTGTGKTLAYLLPILERLAKKPEGRTVILTPSAELAVQVMGIARRYKSEAVTMAGAIAGASHRKAKDKLQKGTRLIVGTPGRIIELYAQRKLKGVTTLVIDEPDPILTGENDRDLRDILSRPEPKVQLVIVGATMGPKTESLIADVVGDDAARVRVDDEPLQTRIAHHFVQVDPQGREVDLVRFIDAQRCRRAIVFVGQPQRIRHLYRFLEDCGSKPVTVSDERSKLQRRTAIDAFTAGDARILITTDAAARGLDVPEVEWVLHYELPSSAQAYLHRAGRTGRAGREGTSVAFVSSVEAPVLQRFGRQLNLHFTPFPRS